MRARRSRPAMAPMARPLPALQNSQRNSASPAGCGPSIHRNQPRFEQIADFQAVHLPALGHVEVFAGGGVAHADLPRLRPRKQPAPAAILVQAEARLRAAEQNVLLLAGQLRALLAQVAL